MFPFVSFCLHVSDTGCQRVWNPRYYDPRRRTITKPLVYFTAEQLRREVRSLIYLAIATNRSLIIPNVLGNELNVESNVQLFGGRALWPGFRVAFFKKGFTLPLQILEPAFYWRMDRDYADADHRVTELALEETAHRWPSVNNSREIGASLMSRSRGSMQLAVSPPVTVVPLQSLRHSSLQAIEELLNSESYRNVPRLVLQGVPGIDASSDSPVAGSTGVSERRRAATENGGDLSFLQHGDLNTAANIRKWAADSVGLFDSYEIESSRYSELPYLIGADGRREEVLLPAVAHTVIQYVRLCERILNPNMGNRSCFDKCD